MHNKTIIIIEFGSGGIQNNQCLTCSGHYLLKLNCLTPNYSGISRETSTNNSLNTTLCILYTSWWHFSKNHFLFSVLPFLCSWLHWVRTCRSNYHWTGDRNKTPINYYVKHVNSWIYIFIIYILFVGGKCGLVVGRWTCNPEVPGSNPTPCH